MKIKLVLAGLILLCPTLGQTIESEKPAYHFRGYHNPPKPHLTVLPVQSRRLDRPGRELFNRSLWKEAKKFDCCSLVPWPHEIHLDTMGQLPPEALPILRKKFSIDMVLQTKLEHTPERNDLRAEMVITQTGDIATTFHQECECPIGEMLFWMVPEAVRKMSLTMKIQAPRCPSGTVLILAPIIPGSREPDSTGKAWGPGNFCMDIYEYPNALGEPPLVAKTWKEASAICQAQGKRLCNEPEWELACRGSESWDYPYGRNYEKARCNTQSQTIQLTGGNAGCKSPAGVFDLSGNVYEWTQSDWNTKFKDKVVKGGNWDAGQENSKCSNRFGQKMEDASQAIGFRCCSRPLR